MDKPAMLQFLGSERVGHDLAAKQYTTSRLWKRQQQYYQSKLQCSCLENPRDRGVWWAAVYGVTQSQTRVKWLSSSQASYRTDLSHRAANTWALRGKDKHYEVFWLSIKKTWAGRTLFLDSFHPCFFLEVSKSLVSKGIPFKVLLFFICLFVLL